MERETGILWRFREVVRLKENEISAKGLSKTYKAGVQFIWLTQKTGIHAASWQKAYRGSQRIREDMMEWLGILYPELIYWLITGAEDVEAWHISASRHRQRAERWVRDEAVEYLRALNNPESTEDEKATLQKKRVEAICKAHGRE